MKLHLPIGLRKALMAVFAALAVSPVMADELNYVIKEATSITGDLLMNSSQTNRIEAGFAGNRSFTVSATGNIGMSTADGVNVIAGNIYEIKEPLITLADNAKDQYFKDQGWPTTGLGAIPGNIAWGILKAFITPYRQAAPTVQAGGSFTMDGPANVVVLGSTVKGNTITLTNNESGITSADAVVKGILGDAAVLADLGPVKSMLDSLSSIQGNFNIVQGSTLGDGNTQSVSMHASLNKKTIPDPLPDTNPITIAANVVLGGSNVTAQNIDMTGMATVITNTPLLNAFNELAGFATGKNDSELILMQNLLGAGKATSLTATSGNIKLGSQFNVLHGGNLDDSNAALKLTANNGAVNIQGTANVLSGNVQVNAGSINLKGERLEGDLPGMVNGMISSLTDKIDGSEAIVDKLVKKGSFNVVTGGATLNATGNIVLNDQPVDDVGATGVINAVLDTELTDLITVVRHGEPSAIMPKADGTLDSVTTTLKSTNGNIDLLGRVNVVNGLRGQVVVDATNGNVNLQGNLSMVSGNASVTGKTININTSEDKKYKMYVDSSELSILPDFAILDKIGGAIEGVAMNAAVVAGGANLTSTGKDKDGNGITIGGTVGLLMNTPVADAIKELNPLNPGKNPSELEIVESLLQKGTATSLTAKEGNILVGSQFNLMHGGGFVKDAVTKEIDRGKNSLTVKAEKGHINVEGTANVVSGNVVVTAGGGKDDEGNIITGNITMTGEVLSDKDMAKAVNGLIVGMNIPGVDKLTSTGILDKLVNKGSVNMVTGGAMLDATGDITMTGRPVDDKEKIGNINAVIDTEIVDVLQAKDGNFGSLVHGGGHMTKLEADGNINLEGRVNVVNGKYVTLDAGKDVNLQGNLSMIGGATVKADGSININTSPEETYKMYMDDEELGALLPKDSSYTKLLTQMGVIDKLGHTGINGAVVAGGAQLEAVDSITTGGTASIFVNTPMAEVGDRLMSLLTDPEHDDEIWMVKELLQKGVATTVTSTNGNIELGSRLNVLYGGGFTTVEDENALSLNAAKGTVKLDGTINMVSGNVQVDANNIELKGNKNVSLNLTPLVSKVLGSSPEYAGLVTGSGMLDKVAVKGINANVVMGGATLKATALETEAGEKVGGNIALSGMANFVLDTQLENVVDAIIETNPQHVAQGGNKLTYLEADGNIDLTGRLNVVNGAYVKLDAGKDVNINGTLNMVSGKAKVNGANINLNGQDNLGLNWGEIIPGDVGNYMDQMGVTDKLNKGVNGNLVLGGAMIEAKNDIKLSGMASVVTNVPLGSAYEALNKKMDETWQPELWLMKEMINDGIATTLTAENGNIEMTSRLNMLHGGNFSADGANALTLEAKKGAVIIAGTANIISGNTQVTAGEGIKITGKTGVGFDWNQIADALPEKYDGYGVLAGKMGILDKLSKGVNGSVIAGGATLTATNGDITMEGMATAVVDVTAKNVLEAVETMNGTPIMEGGAEDTTITAVNGSINLNSRLNLVNGGQVTVNAGQNVNMGGTFNVVSGNATVNAGTNIEMNAQNKVGVDISPMLKGHYAEIAKEMGMADVLKNGVSSNIVAGGANLDAKGDVVMDGVATAIVDTTASNVIGAVKGNDLGELMTGGRSTTEVTAGNDIVLKSQMNVVNGGNGNNAGGVVLDAGRDVIMSGDIDVVNRAAIVAGNNVEFGGDKSVVKYSDINANTVSFMGKNAEITDVNFNTASVEVIGTALVNTADSEVAINELIVDAGNIENLGSLELKAAALAGATLHNAGSIEVNGAMTLNSATLSFVADSNNSTLNSAAITLGAEGSIAGISTFSGNSSTDMIAGVSFLLHYDGIEFIDNTNEFKYNLAIFQGATKDEYNMLVDANAIEMDELTLTLDNGFHIESITSMNVLFSESDGVVYISGTATVPEPTTATLSLLALAALAARRRRQK